MFWSAKNKIGIIGCGNMGLAIAERIKRKYNCFVFDKDKEKTKNLRDIKVTNNVIDLLQNVDAIILAIKPQDFDPLLKEIKDKINNRLVISIAAGITTEYIENILGRVRVIRVMPNLPARFGKGVSCICKGGSSGNKDLSVCLRIFRSLGSVFILSEDLMHAATAVSGSGPAYVYEFLERERINLGDILTGRLKTFEIEFKAAAELELAPLPKKKAHMLVDATIKGSLAALGSSKMAPAQLIEQVASKGGTTEAALRVLHAGGSLRAAIQAASNRSKELSRR